MTKLGLILTLTGSFLFVSNSIAQKDGTIISKIEITNDSLVSLFSRTRRPETFLHMDGGRSQWNDEWKFINDLALYKIVYLSDGLKVTGYLCEPRTGGEYPCIIANRGGNRKFGMWSPIRIIVRHKELIKSGYVVVASNYRGVDGGEGVEEFGGRDIHDVLNLIPVLDQSEKADTARIGMFGWSRGGMMSFLVLKATDRIKAMVVGGGSTNLLNQNRPEMETRVYAELIPNYWENKEEELDKRSAIKWVDKLPKDVPILMMHGTADWRVQPEESLAMALKFQEYNIPYRLIMYEGGDHGINEFTDEVNKEVVMWFDRFLKQGEELPNIELHGR